MDFDALKDVSDFVETSLCVDLWLVLDLLGFGSISKCAQALILVLNVW